MKKTAVDVFGVRISPGIVFFENAYENQTYSEIVSVQNISNQAVTIRILNPTAWVGFILFVKFIHIM